MPEISVIIPVYNAEDFLDKCINSVLNQTFRDFELILVDDGSTDKSGAICDSYSQKDSRVAVLHRENRGVSEARNAGIEQSQGKYIQFVDSDDWMDVRMLELLHDTASGSGADTAGCGHWNAWPSGDLQPEKGALPKGLYGREDILNGIVRPLYNDRVSVDVFNGFIWRFLFSADVIKREDVRFQGAYLEDEVFLIEYFLHAQSLAMVDEPLYYYLQNPRSVTRRYLEGYIDTFKTLLDRKRIIAEKFKPGSIGGWEYNTLWAGLLIAVGNEFSKANPVSWRQKRKNLIAMCRDAEFKEAIENVHPKNAGRNKQIVIDMIRKRRYTLLAALYALKNAGG